MGAVGTVKANIGADTNQAMNNLESVKNAVNKLQEDKFVNDMVKSATSSLPINEVPNPSDLMSNSDVQSAVEAYVMQFGGNENAILDRIRDGIDKAIGGGKPSNISFADMMKQATDAGSQITFSKVVTISPKGYIPEMGKKGDLGKLIDKYNVNSVVVNMYRDKSGANDMKRLKELGFEIKSQTLGTQQEGSKIPPKDYYYMVRKKK